MMNDWAITRGVPSTRRIYGLRVTRGAGRGMVFHQTPHRSDLDRALQYAHDAADYELVEYVGTEWVAVDDADHEGYCDMRAEAEYLRRSELEPDDPPEGEDE